MPVRSCLGSACPAWRTRWGIGSPTIPNLTPLTLPSSGSSTGLGSLATPPGQLLGTDTQQQQPAAPDGSINIGITDSYVSIIDSAAVPHMASSCGFDAAYDIRQPTRAEYMFAKGGCRTARACR